MDTVASNRETVRSGTLARVHERLCPHGCLASRIRDLKPIALYDAVIVLQRDPPGLSMADALALIRECDGW